ncbi:hypothetical protein [Paenibacillus sp. FSL E2-0178]|uniref:hypothetical protein n=1 Tax=Paenibacillus sp. FSL E2-0178 TaxID=2921361 RepID=UPI0031586D79
MNAEFGHSEDELLVKAIHKTVGQIELLKQTCQRLSVNADAELGRFMAETHRLLEKAQAAGQGPETESPDRRVKDYAFIKNDKNDVRPAAAPFVSKRKLIYSPGKAGRLTLKHPPQVKRKRVYRKKRSRLERTRTSGDRALLQRQRTLRQHTAQQPRVWQRAAEHQPKPRRLQPQQPPKVLRHIMPQQPKKPDVYSGIITSQNLKRPRNI